MLGQADAADLISDLCGDLGLDKDSSQRGISYLEKGTGGILREKIIPVAIFLGLLQHSQVAR